MKRKGVDIDWEYPNSTGAGNPHSSADVANLLSLFKSLRGALRMHLHNSFLVMHLTFSLARPKIISAAVPHLPWLGSNGQPLTDVSAYAAVMDYVNIMYVPLYRFSYPALLI